MSVLEISDSKAEQMEKLEMTSAVILQEYLEGKRSGGDDIKIAMQSMNVVAKNRQTTTAREALRYNMVHDLEDPNIRKKYIKSTQPEIKKLIK